MYTLVPFINQKAYVVKLRLAQTIHIPQSIAFNYTLFPKIKCHQISQTHNLFNIYSTRL